MSSDVINRSVGCLVGLAAGDRNGGSLRMALSLTDSIIKNKGEFNINDIGKRYLFNWCDSLNKGYDLGWTSGKVFGLVSSGVPFSVASMMVHNNSDQLTAGIEPAHRAIPLAIMPYRLNDINYIVKKESQLTHIHHLASDVSEIVVRICNSLINEGAEDYNRTVKHFTSKIETIHSGSCCTPDEEKTTYPYKASSIGELSNGGYAPSALKAALYFLKNADTFEEALNDSIEFAGADNYCPALVGAIGGARWGADAIPNSCTEHLEKLFNKIKPYHNPKSLDNLVDVIKERAETLAALKPKRIAGKYYPIGLWKVMEKVHQIIKLTNNSDLHSITKIKVDKGYKAHKSILLEKGFNIPEFSVLGFSNQEYQYINHNINYYAKLLTRDETFSLITGLIEAENQELYGTGSTSSIHILFDHLKKRGHDRYDELEDWAFNYAHNDYVPTGSSGRRRTEARSVSEYYEMRVADQKDIEKSRKDKERKLKEQKRENVVKQIQMRKKQAKNSKARSAEVAHLKKLTLTEMLTVIVRSDKPPYYFPSSLIENLTDEEVDGIRFDIQNLINERIKRFKEPRGKGYPWKNLSQRITSSLKNKFEQEYESRLSSVKMKFRYWEFKRG
jgi:ADP-ribosylglycohydrolase